MIGTMSQEGIHPPSVPKCMHATLGGGEWKNHRPRGNETSKYATMHARLQYKNINNNKYNSVTSK